MRNVLRRSQVGAAVAAAALLLGACGGGDSGGGDSSGDGGNSNAGAGPADLLIWVGAGSGGVATKKVAAAFGEENGVKVDVQEVPGDTLQSNFVTASQAGKGPDVVMGAHDWIGNLVQNGAIDPIQISADTASQLQPLATKAVTFNGQVYGMPYTMNNIVLFRNTKLAPNAPKTIEEMVSVGKKLKAEGKVSEVMALPVGDTGNPYQIQALYTSAGGYMFGQTPDGDFDPKDLGVAKPEAVAAYKKIATLGEKGEGALKRSITTENVVNLFTSGKTPFMIDGPWQLPSLQKSDIKFDASAVPPFAGGKKASPFITVDAAYVASKGKHKQLAQEFVTNFWANPTTGLAYYKAAQGVPASKDVLDQIKSSAPLIVKIAGIGAANGQPMPSIPQMAAVWDPLGKAEAAVIAGKDPASTIGSAAKSIQTAIK